MKGCTVGRQERRRRRKINDGGGGGGGESNKAWHNSERVTSFFPVWDNGVCTCTCVCVCVAFYMCVCICVSLTGVCECVCWIFVRLAALTMSLLVCFCNMCVRRVRSLRSAVWHEPSVYSLVVPFMFGLWEFSIVPSFSGYFLFNCFVLWGMTLLIILSGCLMMPQIPLLTDYGLQANCWWINDAMGPIRIATGIGGPCCKSDPYILLLSLLGVKVSVEDNKWAVNG